MEDQLQFEQNLEIERGHCNGKTEIDGAPNKKRTIVAKFLNFKDKQGVLSKYNALKFLIILKLTPSTPEFSF